MANDFDRDPDHDSAEDEIIVRRIDERLARRDQSDLPWLRRIVGASIIVGAFWYGWTELNRKSDEIVQRTKREAARKLIAVPEGKSAAGVFSGISPESKLGQAVSTNVSANASEVSDLAPPLESKPSVFLSPESLTTISKCTKGVPAFRRMDLGGATSGGSSLESVFKPVLTTASGRARRSVQLQNLRIRTKAGEELRLHASPKTQKGELYLSLFRVAKDGLPEEIPFPPEIADLSGQKVDDAKIAKFLSLSELPGRALAIERHEAWSFPENVGLQIISSDDQIYDLQAFMPNRFLACSRGLSAGLATVNCKCVERGNRP